MMEFLSPSQITQYEQIIDRIDLEHKQSEKLKEEIHKLTDKVVIASLAKSEFNEKISHISVKVFSNIFCIHSLYSGELEKYHELFNKLLKYENTNFYLCEIFIAKVLQQKIRDTKCLINISIRNVNKNLFISKTFNYYISNNKVSMLEVIPVPNNIIESFVEVTLIFPFENKFLYIKLDRIYIDVSYHFQMIKDKIKIVNKNRKLLGLSNLYNNATLNVKDISKPFALEYSISCNNIESNQFIKSFIKNCYHRIDLEMFSELKNELSTIFVIHFSSGIEKHTIVYDKVSRVCQIKASLKYLRLLKEYFFKEFKDAVQSQHTEDLDHITKDLLFKSEDAALRSPTDLCNFYSSVRNRWSALPM